MAGKSDAWEQAVLKMLFNGTALANVMDNAASSPLTNLYVTLLTADPGDAATATTNEVNTTQYPNYARVAVARTSGGWTVSGTSPCVASPVAAINFPATGAGGTGVTASHFGIVSTASGAGVLYYSGTITPNIVIPATTAGVIPQLTTGSTITED